MTGIKLALVVLLAFSFVGVSGCGRKGDLQPPQAALFEAR